MKSLDEAIQHCLEVAERNKKDFGMCPYPPTECDGLHDCRCLENGKEKGCLKCAEEHRQLAEWLRELKRARVLLKATHDLLMKQNDSGYVLNLLSETVFYDEAECSGLCLMCDIENLLDYHC